MAAVETNHEGITAYIPPPPYFRCWLCRFEYIYASRYKNKLSFFTSEVNGFQ
jgi:hypothetical protein